MKQIILLIFGATVVMLAVRRLRVYRLKERHVLMFVFLGLPFLALAIWPAAVGWVAERLNINYQSVALICLAAFLVLTIFELLSIISSQDRKIATLAQIVGIMMEKQGITDRPRNGSLSEMEVAGQARD
jgi:ABC-type branched-subunit amino acid transport system permease subunit